MSNWPEKSGTTANTNPKRKRGFLHALPRLCWLMLRIRDIAAERRTECSRGRQPAVECAHVPQSREAAAENACEAPPPLRRFTGFLLAFSAGWRPRLHSIAPPGHEKPQHQNLPFRFVWRRQARLRKSPPSGRYRYVRRRWHVLFGVVDFMGELLRRSIKPLSTKCTKHRLVGEPRSILLIQLDHLGDAVITTAVLPAIRRRYPEARIEVLAAPWNREVFEACGEIDAVHVSRVNRFGRGWRPHWLLAQAWWGLRLRRRRFDLGIDLRGEMPLAAILWLAGVKRRVGWDCGGGGFLLTESARFIPGRPEVLSRLALLDLIGIAAPADVLGKMPWFIPPPAARSSVADRLDRCDHCDEPLIVLHIGAGTPAKRWPAEHWRELLGRIAVEIGARVVLLGGRSERGLAAEVLEGRVWPGVADWTGQLSVTEMAALIEQADLFVGADSGPAHLAAAVGTSAVVVFSGTNRVRQWRPWGRALVVKHSVACSPCHRQRCPLSEHACMIGITPEAVMRRVRAILDGNVQCRLLFSRHQSIHRPLNPLLTPNA